MSLPWFIHVLLTLVSNVCHSKAPSRLRNWKFQQQCFNSNVSTAKEYSFVSSHIFYGNFAISQAKAISVIDLLRLKNEHRVQNRSHSITHQNTFNNEHFCRCHSLQLPHSFVYDLHQCTNHLYHCVNSTSATIQHDLKFTFWTIIFHFNQKKNRLRHRFGLGESIKCDKGNHYTLNSPICLPFRHSNRIKWFDAVCAHHCVTTNVNRWKCEKKTVELGKCSVWHR